ncbi:tumor necrosis factor ligand superfamily member 11 [Protopterus annectens]|uniref:tumor necrosis factor ligand superfamily member 11 n=1 Tax=Protopterus annectens TaxID=7888 RepID=UPI001CF952C2|nr:tumor necrosis factor ligand superfamily member 11 [Protopterus annectens]
MAAMAASDVYLDYVSQNANGSSVARLGTVPVARTVVTALVFLGLTQVLSTVGLFLYFRSLTGEISPNQPGGSYADHVKASTDETDTTSTKDRSGMALSASECISAICRQVDHGEQISEEYGAQHESAEGGHSSKGYITTYAFSNKEQMAKNEQWPIAHLTLNYYKNITKDIAVSSQQIVPWEHTKGLGIMTNMTLFEGKLKIHQNGFYYVYINIGFRYHRSFGEKKHSSKGQPLLTYVFRKSMSRSDSILLMKGGSSRYWNSSAEYNFYSTYQGGVFMLKYGDEIYVNVTDASLVDREQSVSYFGAFKVLSSIP